MMTTKITLVGLGQIGTSVGLALEESGKDFDCTGFDIEPKQAKQAGKLGAVNQLAATLPQAVRKADIVLLALPIDQVRETLEIISGNLKENAIILDTSPVREEPTRWADELLPKNCPSSTRCSCTRLRERQTLTCSPTASSPSLRPVGLIR